MAQVQDKIVKSKYPPKDTNVVWVDTSENSTVIKVFNNGLWSGQDSEDPTYAGSNGDVMQSDGNGGIVANSRSPSTTVATLSSGNYKSIGVDFINYIKP